ncbi:carboxymuconolactone decarboxylase family protein [Pseudorhodoplanes sp.]|uniref:carboxymuconolactone decarboxylase family protein n=1 Tax=Pseudorhodoplanes sp. TaxID=1934341 RepID=UPI00391BF4F7
MKASTSIDYRRQTPAILQALTEAERVISQQNFDRRLYHLVKLRASQLNRCAYCIDLHLREARQDGETNERLDRVIVFDRVEDFTEREKAALAWTDALTLLGRDSELTALRMRLNESFTESEVAVLTSIVAMINLWNRLQVASH